MASPERLKHSQQAPRRAVRRHRSAHEILDYEEDDFRFFFDDRPAL